MTSPAMSPAMSPVLSPAACPALVVDLAHRRWTIPLLAQLHQARVSTDSTGARFIGLVHRLGIGRETLRQTLEYATAHGWVVRNAGHGHPLRPEFVLSRAGAEIAPACGRVWRTAVLLDLAEPIGRKWTVPILRVLGVGPSRFGEFREALGRHGLTDRALAQSLRGLASAGLLTRRVTPAPVVSYAATDRARPLVQAIARL